MKIIALSLVAALLLGVGYLEFNERSLGIKDYAFFSFAAVPNIGDASPLHERNEFTEAGGGIIVNATSFFNATGTTSIFQNVTAIGAALTAPLNGTFTGQGAANSTLGIQDYFINATVGIYYDYMVNQTSGRNNDAGTRTNLPTLFKPIFAVNATHVNASQGVAFPDSRRMFPVFLPPFVPNSTMLGLTPRPTDFQMYVLNATGTANATRFWDQYTYLTTNPIGFDSAANKTWVMVTLNASGGLPSYVAPNDILVNSTTYVPVFFVADDDAWDFNATEGAGQTGVAALGLLGVTNTRAAEVDDDDDGCVLNPAAGLSLDMLLLLALPAVFMIRRRFKK